MTILRRVFVMLVATLSAVSSAQAALILARTFGGTNFCAADQNVTCTFGTQLPDSNPTPGQLALGGTVTPIFIGGLEIFGSLQEQTLGPPLNILNSSSLSVTNLTGATINGMFTVGATNYVGPVSQEVVRGSRE